MDLNVGQILSSTIRIEFQLNGKGKKLDWKHYLFIFLIEIVKNHYLSRECNFPGLLSLGLISLQGHTWNSF